MAWEFFDGACEGVPTCGAGGILFLKEKHFIIFNYVVGNRGWGWNFVSMDLSKNCI
jgi:ribonuclease HI